MNLRCSSDLTSRALDPRLPPAWIIGDLRRREEERQRREEEGRGLHLPIEQPAQEGDRPSEGEAGDEGLPEV